MRKSALSRFYAHMISLGREFRHSGAPRRENADSATSPALIFIATILGTLLAIIEIDLYFAELQAIGLINRDVAIDPIFRGP
ncbi:hypothetical protein [Bradyrhizobium prioriisuperbiae]|uniref:hypothetical protein n=1 Tax=Bradyrhizobium prioriisuperbiae TaxID=2854389 RepID=UPI0028E894BE|nr:hypothetical protein [Bradyrhizobium prioritasuperba]